MLLLVLLILGFVDKEQYYNAQAQNWGMCKTIAWVWAGKPYKWLKF